MRIDYYAVTIQVGRPVHSCCAPAIYFCKWVLKTIVFFNIHLLPDIYYITWPNTLLLLGPVLFFCPTFFFFFRSGMAYSFAGVPTLTWPDRHSTNVPKNCFKRLQSINKCCTSNTKSHPLPSALSNFAACCPVCFITVWHSPPLPPEIQGKKTKHF